MTARILPLNSRRRPPSPVGPVSAQVSRTTVRDGGADGPLLEIALTLRLVEVTPEQRRALADLLHDSHGVGLTLSGRPEG